VHVPGFVSFPNTLDRHLCKEWLKTLGLTVGAVLGLFYVQNMYDNLGEFIKRGASAAEILQYYLLITPSLLSPVIPLSVLIATLLSYGGLHKNQEINAMRSIGSGLFHLMRANLLITILLTAGLYTLSLGGQSWSVEKSRELFEKLIEHRDLSGKKLPESEMGWVRQIAFENKVTRHFWLFNSFHKPTQTAYGAYLYFRDKAGNEEERLTARTATWEPETQTWLFREGRRVFFDENRLPLRFENFDERRLKGLDEPGTLLAPTRKLSDLSIQELHDQAMTGSLGYNKESRRYQIRYFQSLAGPINCILGLMLGVPFAIAGQRINPMVGATRAIGIFVAYFMLSGFCRMLGENALLVPAAAGIVPPLLLGIYAIWKMIKVR